MSTGTTGPTKTSRNMRVASAHGRLLPANLRETHRTLVLQALYRSEPKSRADLARTTGLTRVTASDVIKDLLESGLVQELGLRDTARIGKPATLIGFDPASRVIASIDLSTEGQFTATLLDLEGNAVTQDSEPLHGATGEDALAIADLLTQRIVGKAKAPVLGLGIIAPGIVDSNGAVQTSVRLGWNNVPLAEHLAELTGLPTHVANDADMAALAECTFGDGSEDALLAVRLINGVGAGILVDGALLNGIGGTAGEIGHIKISDEPDMCACGSRGCMETQITSVRLRERTSGLDSADAAEVLTQAGHLLGTVIAPCVLILGTSDVVLSGPSEIYGGAFLDALNATLAHRANTPYCETPRARLTELGPQGTQLGAAALVLRNQLGLA